MRQPIRLGMMVVAAALVFSACSSATTTPTPAPTATPAPPASATAAANTSAPTATPTPVIYTGPKVTITWFCCLGTGEDASQQAVEKQVVADFNAAHPNINLVFELNPYTGARDKLSTELASGNGPDVVGPVGVGGSEAFHGQWADLAPWITKYNYDLSEFDQSAIDFYKQGGEGQIGLPFAVYPSELYYQKAMFDEAGLEYPPAKYGDKYTMPDGSVVDWNYDTVRKVAMMLTIDKSGCDATQSCFDPKNVVQYGFEPQRDDLRGLGAYFGAGQLLGSDGKTAQIPADWAYGWKWAYNGIWTDHFIETNSVYQSTAFNGGGYTFNSGKVAMQENFLWNVCCITNAGRNWDLAALPSNPNTGKVTATFNADTFRVLKSSKNQEAAFIVLTYLLGEGSQKLLNAYSGFPARKSLQADFFTQLEKQTDPTTGKPVFPAKVNWAVAIDGIKYADVPNMEAYMPAYNATLDRLQTSLTRWTSTGGLNMDTEISSLQSDIQKIWDKAGQ
ncbi:MAG: extracellular solute-binding protein [Candidatus Limnocylindrales bacterium]